MLAAKVVRIIGQIELTVYDSVGRDGLVLLLCQLMRHHWVNFYRLQNILSALLFVFVLLFSGSSQASHIRTQEVKALSFTNTIKTNQTSHVSHVI